MIILVLVVIDDVTLLFVLFFLYYIQPHAGSYDFLLGLVWFC